MRMHRSRYCTRKILSLAIKKLQIFFYLDGILALTVTGTVYDRCGYTVPVSPQEGHFPLIKEVVDFCFFGRIFTHTEKGTKHI